MAAAVGHGYYAGLGAAGVEGAGVLVGFAGADVEYLKHQVIIFCLYLSLSECILLKSLRAEVRQLRCLG